MKKIIGLVLALSMTAVVLTACGEEKKPAETAAAQTETLADAGAQAAAPAAAGKYSFATKGTVVEMKADFAPIHEALGKEKSYTEETSCAFDGLDKNYVYSSYIITTYPDGNVDKVNSLTLVDDTVSTTDGICITDSKDKVESVYGADSFNGVNAYVMQEGNAKLTIIMDGDKVSSIQYNAVFE